MEIEKLPSGSYRVRKYSNGKRHTVTFDHKPTIKEAEKAIAEKVGRPRTNSKSTFNEVAMQYMEDKSNVLSPSTIRGYNNCLKQMSDRFKNIKVDDINQVDVQREINRLAESRSSKTVKNYHGFIASVLALYRPDLALKTTLPMIVNEEPYVPSTDELKALLKEAEGTPYLLCLYLGSLGMRRSEICALTEDDLDGNVLHIRKSMVQGKDEEWFIKPYPKTSKSARDIVLPDEVVSLINENGMYKGRPHSISYWMMRKQKKIGMNRFSLHKLRHYFASNAHELGLSDAMIQAYGGWSTDQVMKRVYRHATESSKVVSDVMGKNLFS